MDLWSLVGFIVVAAAVVLTFLRGWRETAAHLAPGVLILAAGLVLTVVLRGNVIFIGAIVVGILLTLRGFYLLIFDA